MGISSIILKAKKDLLKYELLERVILFNKVNLVYNKKIIIKFTTTSYNGRRYVILNNGIAGPEINIVDVTDDMDELYNLLETLGYTFKYNITKELLISEQDFTNRGIKTSRIKLIKK